MTDTNNDKETTELRSEPEGFESYWNKTFKEFEVINVDEGILHCDISELLKLKQLHDYTTNVLKDEQFILSNSYEEQLKEKDITIEMLNTTIEAINIERLKDMQEKDKEIEALKLQGDTDNLNYLGEKNGLNKKISELQAEVTRLKQFVSDKNIREILQENEKLKKDIIVLAGSNDKDLNFKANNKQFSPAGEKDWKNRRKMK